MKRVVIGDGKIPTIRVLRDSEIDDKSLLISDYDCSRFMTAQERYNKAFQRLISISRQVELKKEIFDLKTDDGRFIRGIVMSAESCGVGYATKLARELLGMGPRSKALAERYCNRSLYPHEKEEDENLDVRVLKIGMDLGLKAYRQGDPRGWTIRVEVDKQYTTCWDGETVGCG
jgi:hypothetical protein